LAKGGMTLLKKGAEADLYLGEWYGMRAVYKVRGRKGYRAPQLDERIREARTAREASMIHDAKLLGVPTPCVYSVDLRSKTIVLEFIEGMRMKEALEPKRLVEPLPLFEVGECVGKMHSNGIIHGDLTTSNIMVLGEGGIALIDFGLSFRSSDEEDMGTDLLILKRALGSLHHDRAEAVLKRVLDGYRSMIGSADGVVRKMLEVERRGRYFSGR
jgi:Kae1-associated kinase Bud32